MCILILVSGLLLYSCMTAGIFSLLQFLFMPDLIFAKQEECEKHCPDACDTFSDSARLSYTKVSGEGMLKTLSSDSLSQILSKYQASNNLRSRLESVKFEEVLYYVQNMESKLEMVYNFVRSNVHHEFTSVTHRVVKAANLFSGLIVRDLEESIFVDLDNYKLAYSNTTKGSVESLNQMVDTVSVSLHELISGLKVRLEGASFEYTNGDGEVYWENLKTVVSTDAAGFEQKFAIYYELDALVSNSPYVMSMAQLQPESTLTFDTACDPAYLNEEIYEFFEYFNSTELSSDIFIPSDYPIEILEEGYDRYQQFKVCISSYGKFLNELDAWMDNLEQEVLEVNTDDIADQITQLYQGMTSQLTKFFEEYTSNRISKMKLSEEIINLDLTTTHEDLRILLNSFKTDVTNTLRGDMDMFSKDVQTIYQEGLQLIDTFASYVKDKRFDERTRNASIWMKPFPKLDTPQVCTSIIHLSEVLL